MFWCEHHQREEDSDEVGYVESHDGGAVCQAAQDEAEYTLADYRQDRADEANDEAWLNMTLAQKREAMGGEFGGDGAED